MTAPLTYHHQIKKNNTMNYFLFSSVILVSFTNGWGWPRTQSSMAAEQCSNSSSSSSSTASAGCPPSSGSPDQNGKDQLCYKPQMWNLTSADGNNTAKMLNESVCWDSMLYQSLNLTNVTAIYQPGSWESEYQKIQDFCSARGNGSFCYQPSSDQKCLSMAVLRCPEGILSSCRAGFMCGEIYSDQNVTCTCKNMTGLNETSSQSSSKSCFNSSLFNFTESGQAACWAISDVLMWPEAENITTTTDTQNNTITVGKQAFGYPFATSTTVDCTMTCVSSLPAGLPQPTGSVCFNPSLPYDEMIPKSTCAGPYPPGPMTTVTVCPTERAGGINSSTTELSSSMSESSMTSTPMSSSSPSSSICPTSVSSESMLSSAMTTAPVQMYNDYGRGGQSYQDQDQGQGNDYSEGQGDYSNENDSGDYAGDDHEYYGADKGYGQKY